MAVCGDGDHFYSGILVRIYCQNSRPGVVSGFFEGFSLTLFSNVCARAATAFWSELAIVLVIGFRESVLSHHCHAVGSERLLTEEMKK